MRFRTAPILAIALLVASTLAWSRPAHAKAEMLKRSASNILQAPLDFALLPYTAVDTLVQNYYRSKRHGVVEKVALTPVMGVIYLPACTFAGGFVPAYRFVEGALTLPFAAALAGTEVDIHLYEPVHGRRGAVVDKDPLYFGGRYCEGFFK